MINQIYPNSKRLGELLKTQRLKIVTAESCTSGGLAYYLTAVSGSSEYLDRGFVTYSNQAKIDVLGVKPDVIEKFGAVSEQTAKAMAEGALRNSQADVAITITGVAGPLGGTLEKPVGLVCFGFMQKNQTAKTAKKFFTPDRAHIRHQAIAFALQWGIENISSK